jgi:16S rRNA (cytosine967-C5)-methyltransferase
MKLSSLLGHLAELLEAAARSADPADRVAGTFFARRRYIGARDRRWIAPRFYEILRNHRLLDRVAAQALARTGVAPPPVVHPVLVLAAHEARQGGTNPGELRDEIAGLWRLSGFTSDPAPYLAAAADPALPDLAGLTAVQSAAVRFSLHDSLLEEWAARFGREEAERIAASLNTGAPVTLRVNTLRTTPESCRAALAAEGIHASPGRWSPTALVAAGRFAAASSPSFRAGMFELQDEGSQLLALLLDPRPGESVLDACAGGGGKTLALAALMRNEGTLAAEDVNDLRLKAVRERCGRAGVTVATVRRAGTGERSPAQKVLVDAPCSGVGTFRRNPGAKLRFTPAASERYAALQRRILEDTAPRVLPGGRLVYATCTLVRRENEEVAEWFLSAHPEFDPGDAGGILSARRVPLPESSSAPHLLLLPHRTGTDGFFAAVFTRRA